MRLKLIVILLGLIFWPLHLFLENTQADFITYTFPAFTSKLAVFPLIFIVIYIALHKRITTKYIVFFFAALILFVGSFKAFAGQTIFNKDYEAQQLVIREGQLYKDVLLARMFHNKVRIFVDKFSANFFALTDPNNYFFRFAPRQITLVNQNLKKFPTFALVFVLVGLYSISKAKHKNLLIASLIAGILSLSLLTYFDRNDFILWFPLSAIFIHGVNQLSKSNKKYIGAFFGFFVVFSLIELIQIIVQSTI